MQSKDRKWGELLQEFIKGVDKSIEHLSKRDIDDIVGAKEALLKKLEFMKLVFPQNEGDKLKQAINNKIQEGFFPITTDFEDAFIKILNSRTHEQDFIINELVNGFIASESSVMALGTQGTFVDRIAEAFSKRTELYIVDHQLHAMFGDPNKPKAHVKKQLEKIVHMFGLVLKELVVEKDVRKSERKVYTFYTFPKGVLNVLKEKYINIDETSGREYVSEDFNRNVFICMFLANTSVNRNDLKQISGYTINGISTIFALILFLSLMPKVTPEDTDPISRDEDFDPTRMSIIPKSWMMKRVLDLLFLPLIKIVAYRIGGSLWLSKIAESDIRKHMHNQARLLLRDVSPWIIGNLCRVEIPIFVEIANIFTEVFVSTDASGMNGDDE